MVRTPEEVIALFAEAYNRHDANAAAMLYAGNVRAHDPAYPEQLASREAVRRSIETYSKAFPDIHLNIFNVICEGKTVYHEFEMTGTHKGPFPGPDGIMPPTGSRIRIHGAAVITLNDDGLIAQERWYYDTAAFLRQLGVLELQHVA